MPVLVRTPNPTKYRPTRRSSAIRRQCKKNGRKHKNHKVVVQHRKKRRLNRIETTRSRGGLEWNIHALPKSRHLVRGGLTIRRNARWLSDDKSPSCQTMLPLIDNCGKFTGIDIYVSNLTHQEYLSTIIATIFRRLKLWALRSNSVREVNCRQRLLLRCAAYYTLSRNNYFWDRLLGLVRCGNLHKNWQIVSKVLHSYSSKLDDHKWFVYGHACLQANWLTSRALRPRDKSALYRQYSFMIDTQWGENDKRSHIYDSIYYSFLGSNRLCCW